MTSVIFKNFGGPNKGIVMEFDSEYTREMTMPKTDVNITIQYDWIENG